MTQGHPAAPAGGQPESLDERIPVRGEVLVHEVTASDETVLYALASRELLLLNDVGAGVWYLLDGRRTVAEIVEQVRAHFSDTDADIAGDVVRFLSELEVAGVVRFA